MTPPLHGFYESHSHQQRLFICSMFQQGCPRHVRSADPGFLYSFKLSCGLLLHSYCLLFMFFLDEEQVRAEPE